MAFWIYSTEPLPNEKMMGIPGYTPDNETIRTGGVTINVPAKQWMKLQGVSPDGKKTDVGFFTRRHRDWKDVQGVRERIDPEQFQKVIEGRWAMRGVIFLDHEPSAEEKRTLAEQSEDANLSFRMRVIEEYENQVREREVTGHGRTKPTPYEDQCYEILGLTKPYSVEAMRAQRHPGEAVGEQIVAALERLEQRRKQQAVQPAK